MSKETILSYYIKGADGGRAARGLTETETDELERMWLDRSTGRDIDAGRFLQLSNQHELARKQGG